MQKSSCVESQVNGIAGSKRNPRQVLQSSDPIEANRLRILATSPKIGEGTIELADMAWRHRQSGPDSLPQSIAHT